MRGVTAVLMLVLAACSTAGGDTTTTAPLVEPPTTTTKPTTTTTTAQTTTSTTVEECTERDGVMRNSRGFVCPPHLITVDSMGVGGADTAIHLPGTYETRLFTLPLRFTRDGQFTSPGESPRSVALDVPSGFNAPFMDMWNGDAATHLASLPELQPVNRPEDWTWTEDIETDEIAVGGYTASAIKFTANCLDETKAANAEECFFSTPAAFGEGLLVSYHGERVAVIVVDTPEPLTITIGADQRVFDTYWTEVAQPILDSIEFLDP